jgi:predicted Zn-dependent protease
MKKLIIQFLGLIAIFLLAWYGLSQIPWVRVLKIEKIEKRWEDKVGDLYWNFFKHNEKESTDTLLFSQIDSITKQICTLNDVDTQFIKIHILENSDINAFALPGKHIILLSGLIEFCDTPEQLCGVICHELAHIQLNHISKKLIKEVGLAILTSTTNEKTIQIAQAAKILSSTAFDRNMEKDADIKAVDYMIAASINPAHFADFMNKMKDEKEGALFSSFTWLNTHPDPETRAAYILEYIEERSPSN